MRHVKLGYYPNRMIVEPSRSETRTGRLLQAAEAVLSAKRRPLTAAEIVAEIKEDRYLRNVLNGRTPHKTVQARIATDIISNQKKSRFYRFSPATFGLRALLTDVAYDRAYKRTTISNRRKKQISNEYVAFIPRGRLEFLTKEGFHDSKHYPLSVLNFVDVRYAPRREIEYNRDVLQLVSYAAILAEDCVLTYEKGRFISDDEFIGRLSIGVGGHLSVADHTFFDTDGLGLSNNILREIHEELYLVSAELRNCITDIQFMGYLVDKTTENGQRHLGLAAAVHLTKRIDLASSALGIRNLHWTKWHRIPNSFQKYEIWSKYLLKALELEKN